jgi:3-oxoacyl-[acyl-carrier protein] reductase
MTNLDGKVALITGASGGIGKAISKRLLDAGAVITISGTREEKLKALKDDLGNSDKIHIYPCNLQDKEAVKELPKSVEKDLGSLDILVCNAGITKDNLLMRMSEEDFEDVLNINLTASFILIKNSIRGMMKKRFGRIITIGSIVGTMGNAGQANYVASKAGMAGMVKSISLEVASRGITVNNIAPGFIETPMTEALAEDVRNKMMANIPAGKFGAPEDIANVVGFLASEESSYITGQTLHVNGGMLMV